MAVPLTDRERSAALVIAALGLAALVAIRWGSGLLLIGVFESLMLAVSAWRRERVWTAVLAFLTGVAAPWGAFFLLGAIFIVLAFVLVRAGRQVPDDQRGARR